jgi:transcriptional antiterminator RfaH
VNAQTGREKLAELHLHRQNYETFLPLNVKTDGRGPRQRRMVSAYFAGYLFVRLDLTVQRWRPIDSTVGVLRIVKIGDFPAPAPVGLVEGIRDLVGATGLYEPPAPKFGIGDSVKVMQGPFASHLAVVERLDGPGRVRVLLTLMQQAIPIAMSTADLTAA